MTDAYIDPTRDSFRAFREDDRPGPVHMLNLIRYHPVATYPDGTTCPGAEAYAAYARESGPVFRALGGRQVWTGKPELMLIGPEAEAWDLAFIAEYPSVQAFVSMLRDPEYRKAVIHRQVAVADSRLIRMHPATPGAHFGDMTLD